MQINCQECNGRGAYDVDGQLKSCKTCDATGRIECPCETNQKQLKEQKQTETATVSAHPVDHKGRHLYYSFLAEEFDWARFISDFKKDKLTWAVVELESDIAFCTLDYNFYTETLNRLHSRPYLNSFTDNYYTNGLYHWYLPKTKLRPLLKILRAKNKKRFSVHCGYEND